MNEQPPKEVPNPSHKGTSASQGTQLQEVHLPGPVLTPLQHPWEGRDHQVQSRRNDTPTLVLPRSQSRTASVGCSCEVAEGSQESC